MTNDIHRHIDIRGIYGGLPERLMTGGQTLPENGVNGIWLRADTVAAAPLDVLHAQGCRVFAEFNTMHAAAYVQVNPDAAPVGADGLPCPPPDDWQGACPTHPGYRANRMAEFRALLTECDIDGVWLDYHHSHASWEQAEPNLPDTCFCSRCLARFQKETGAQLPTEGVLPAERLLSDLNPLWTGWRCSVFTDWVREIREIRDSVRPRALLGTFHCPWTDTERDAALMRKLAIDLKSQARHIDVFSPMPYHARFGYNNDIEWIARQTKWLGKYLDITPHRRHAVARGAKHIWPILQVSDWGETVTPESVTAALEAGSRPPSTGIIVFNWGSFQNQVDKVDALSAYYRGLA